MYTKLLYSAWLQKCLFLVLYIVCFFVFSIKDINIDALIVSWTCEMWMALGADPIVANQIIEMVMEKLAIMAPYVDKKESMIRGGTMKVATNQPLAVSCKDTHRHRSLKFYTRD